MNRGNPIRRVVVEQGSGDYPWALKILDRVPVSPVYESPLAASSEIPASLEPDKETLRLVSFPGDFFKPCPGTREYLCCGYRILHAGTNCPLDCSYCILQAYLNQPSLRVFVNLEEELPALASQLDAQPEKIFRVGTGEFMDSLALDPWVKWTDLLLPFFSRRGNAILELKTKTDHVDVLISSKVRKRIVVSWSLNAPSMAAGEEHRAPSIRRRLQAARVCQREGFAVGFHFDPLIQHPGWKDGYRRTLDMLDRYVLPGGVIWISLGCMRYVPALKPIIRRRHPRSVVLDGEFILGQDGKMRYFKPIRTDMYGFLAEHLGAWSTNLGLYLCMESRDVWQDALGWTPPDSAALAAFLDGRVEAFFGRGSIGASSGLAAAPAGHDRGFKA
ncbi:MAG: DNA photolyase [Deltaproteobacteria bacterium]|nr:DNA photolyase [Deltaproteobacteria bacterium]